MMNTEMIQLAGDVPGNSIELRVLRFEGKNEKAATAYLQSSLHGSELPGQAALHFLVPMLEKAERESRVAGNITVVPQANPIGSAQWLSHQHLGRFEYFSNVNFNRSFPLLETFDTSGLAQVDAPKALAERLKAQLLRLALPHEIVLDLHCDDESESYLYIHRAFLPEMYDLASALGSTAILSWDSTADAAFEEACAHPVLQLPEAQRKARAVTTVEFRGLNDVDIETGRADAEGLYRFLVHRGVIVDPDVELKVDFSGPVTPLENVEMIRAPLGGMVLFHVDVGAEVEAGARLVTVVTVPGDPDGDITLTAPQAGRILTRRSHRYTRRGDDLMKLLGTRRSDNARPGSLEAR
jgi:predicted deacylase